MLERNNLFLRRAFWKKYVTDIKVEYLLSERVNKKVEPLKTSLIRDNTKLRLFGLCQCISILIIV